MKPFNLLILVLLWSNMLHQFRIKFQHQDTIFPGAFIKDIFWYSLKRFISESVQRALPCVVVSDIYNDPSSHVIMQYIICDVPLHILIDTLSIINLWMDQEIPFSWRCSVNYLVNKERICLIGLLYIRTLVQSRVLVHLDAELNSIKLWANINRKWNTFLCFLCIFLVEYFFKEVYSEQIDKYSTYPVELDHELS